ncbi:MAG TPA: radical SAM protein [Desulfobacterales bacterium]|nr:radical SAM protein [Desulfobacterales bacterium]
MKYLFGPVPSRRLGMSLGVDLITPKTCPFDCIYCEVGPTTVKTRERREYIPAQEILAELEEYLANASQNPDYITLAGSGEPTLNSALGRIIRRTKELTSTPVAVLTNGALLSLPEVRREIINADVILPSLDAVTPALFEMINRPVAGLIIGALITGLHHLRAEYSGQIWLEILLLRGLNDTETELANLKKAIQKLQPDRVQLNTAVRPATEETAKPLTPEELAAAASFLGEGTEVIADFSGSVHPTFILTDSELLATLARRPQTARDLAEVLGMPLVAVMKRLDHLFREGRVSRSQRQNRIFYQTH